MPIEPDRIQPLTLTTAEVTITLSGDALLAIAAAVSDQLQPAAKPAASPYMTVAEAAAYIRANPQRIYDLVSSRRLPKHKDGSRLLILRSELDEYLTGRGQAR
jgi:excisionase family DNA binding protein